MVFADVAAALVDNRGFAEVHAAPSTPWDHPGYFETGFGSNTDALLASMGGDTKFGGAGAMMNGMSGNSTSQNASGKNEMYDKAFSAFEGLSLKHILRCRRIEKYYYRCFASHFIPQTIRYCFYTFLSTHLSQPSTTHFLYTVTS